MSAPPGRASGNSPPRERETVAHGSLSNPAAFPPRRGPLPRVRDCHSERSEESWHSRKEGLRRKCRDPSPAERTQGDSLGREASHPGAAVSRAALCRMVRGRAPASRDDPRATQHKSPRHKNLAVAATAAQRCGNRAGRWNGPGPIGANHRGGPGTGRTVLTCDVTLLICARVDGLASMALESVEGLLVRHGTAWNHCPMALSNKRGLFLIRQAHQVLAAQHHNLVERELSI